MAKETQPVPGRTGSIRCYVAVVGSDSHHSRIVGLGETGQEARDVLRKYCTVDIDVTRCQQVTITPGWGDETEPRLAFTEDYREVERQGW